MNKCSDEYFNCAVSRFTVYFHVLPSFINMWSDICDNCFLLKQASPLILFSRELQVLMNFISHTVTLWMTCSCVSSTVSELLMQQSGEDSLLYNPLSVGIFLLWQHFSGKNTRHPSVCYDLPWDSHIYTQSEKKVQNLFESTRAITGVGPFKDLFCISTGAKHEIPVWVSKCITPKTILCTHRSS